MFSKQLKRALLGLVALSSLAVTTTTFAQERRGNIDECSKKILEGDGGNYTRQINSMYDYWYEKGEFESQSQSPAMTRYKLEQLRWAIYGGKEAGQENAYFIACNDLARGTNDWKELDELFKGLDAKMVELETFAGLEFAGLYDYDMKQDEGPLTDGKGIPTFTVISTGEWLDPSISDDLDIIDYAPCTSCQ